MPDFTKLAFHFYDLIQCVSAIIYLFSSLTANVSCAQDSIRYIAVGAILGCLMLFSCSCSLYNSLIVCFCDRETMQRSFFVSTILSNAFSCLVLLAIALILGNHSPSIAFTRDTYIFSALLSVLFAYPLWLYVPEPEGDTLTEPISLSTATVAIINGAQALAKNRYVCLLRQPGRSETVFVAGSSSSSRLQVLFCRME